MLRLYVVSHDVTHYVTGLYLAFCRQRLQAPTTSVHVELARTTCMLKHALNNGNFGNDARWARIRWYRGGTTKRVKLKLSWRIMDLARMRLRYQRYFMTRIATRFATVT